MRNLSNVTQDEINAYIEAGHIERVDIDRATGYAIIKWAKREESKPLIVCSVDGRMVVVPTS